MRRNRRARTRHGTINAPGNQLLDIDIEDLSFTNLLLELREKPHDLLAIIERQRTTALNLQRQVVADYRSGELLRQANNLTMTSGHGRLKQEDGSFIDIGGSTGGFVRIALDDWEPPDVETFEGYKSYVW